MTIDTAQRPTVAVIGGGIIGLAVAERLLRDGFEVTLIEREGVGRAASGGNAAAFAFSDIMPLASPGMVRKALGWFVNPAGPFAVKLTDLPWTLPWLLRFLAASRPSRVLASVEAQAALLALSRTTMAEMIRRCDLQSHLGRSGALHIYDREIDYQADRDAWALRRHHGIEFTELRGDALHQKQPGLSRQIKVGVWVPQWQTVADPLAFCQALHHCISALGAKTLKTEVRAIHADDSSVRLTLSDGCHLATHHAVLAAGPWSATLCARIGESIPLIGERGYNTTFPADAFELRQMLIFSSHAFVASPLACGVRIGGASEIAKLDRPADFRRSSALIKRAAKLLPGLRTEGGTAWMGQRPTLPDTLPVISPSAISRRLIYAFGHGHLGLTQSAATALLVSELIRGSGTSIDVYPFRSGRFRD